MIKNGVNAIHLATGLIVGYPPCPYINYFKSFIEEKYNIPVAIGTHPIPEKYLKTHSKLWTYDTQEWREIMKLTLTNEKIRLSYD